MSDKTSIDSFLAGAGVANWSQTRLPQDASARYYLRLTHKNQSAILMVAEMDTQFEAFIKIAELLSENSLSAPKILARGEGLLLLEDLGPLNAAEHLRHHPRDEAAIYMRTLEAIDQIQAISHPPKLPVIDAKTARNLAELFREWWSPTLSHAAFDALENAWRALEPCPRVISLRDLHAENIIWRPEKTGLEQVGLLDFQDAVLTHPLYDLVSLLRDARRDVQASTSAAAKRAFLATHSMSDREFERAFATISAQRALRILGIFRRLELRDGRTKYRAFVPRVVSYLRQDLEHPDLHELAELIIPEIKQYD